MLTDSKYLVLDARLINAACDAFDASGAYAQAHPTEPARPDLVNATDVATRAAFGTKRVAWSCMTCGKCFVRVRNATLDGLVRSTCCDATIRLDMPKKFVERLAHVA